MANKIDSNITGLRYAEETSLKVLPGTPVWYPLEPNSYSDFGGQIATIARNPINPSRQRKKGVTTDLDASGGFNQDLTYSNTTRLLQGFFFADARQKFNTQKITGAAFTVITNISTTDDSYNAAAGLGGLLAGDILLAEGNLDAGNNGLKTVVSSVAAKIVVSENLVTDAAPLTTSRLQLVGHKFAAADISINEQAGLVQLVSAAFTMTTLPLAVGDWIFIGDDGASQAFVNNIGFARVSRIAATLLEFDKVSWTTPVDEAGAGLTIRIWYGDIIRNEPLAANIKRRTYQVERTLGTDANGTMSEYLVGAVPNELTINVKQADKVTIDLSFVAVDNEQRTGLTGVKGGTRPSNVPESAYNTSSDPYRIKLASVSTTNASIAALFAYATDLTLKINNNVTPNKAVGVLGAFDTSAGTFEVGGDLTAYFADVTAVQAVRNNGDITIDLSLTKDNKGLIFDIPLLSLGGGRLGVEQDQAIKLPLEQQGAESAYGWTLQFQNFPYLPTLAM